MNELYADGGVIGPNPSIIGGTWAWLLVKDGVPVKCNSGSATPSDIGVSVITNNTTELLAVVEGLESLPEHWTGMVYTDSQVTIYRVHDRMRLRKLDPNPSSLFKRLDEQIKKREGMFVMSLLGGHPTKADLKTGFRKKDGRPCSKHNVFCDELCNEEAQLFMDIYHGKVVKRF